MVFRLAAAARDGVAAVRRLRAEASAPAVRDACDRLLAQLGTIDPAFAAGLLAGAATTVRRLRAQQTLTIVWTGPESGVTTSRLTAATVVDLIRQARREILLVSYATQTEPALDAALAEAASRGVEITLLAERHADNPAYSDTRMPFLGLPSIRLHWPAEERPPGAALHAKIIVIDDRAALVTSANLTSRAMEANLECGTLLRGGPQPAAIREHIWGLWSCRQLRRL
jgi:phosphatidylserine/phosphatidylglycerophosphate/cardiolipin synthase-like enzyme